MVEVGTAREPKCEIWGGGVAACLQDLSFGPSWLPGCFFRRKLCGPINVGASSASPIPCR